MDALPEIFEIIMLVCFRASWPFNVVRSYKSRTAKGRSLFNLSLIILGYATGIISKCVIPDFSTWISTKWYVLMFYIFNLTIVLVDFALYWRNRKLDKERAMKMVELITDEEFMDKGEK